MALNQLGLGFVFTATWLPRAPASRSSLLQADGLIRIEGTTVAINGRLVLPGGGAI